MKTTTTLECIAFAMLGIASGPARAASSFDGITCQSDVRSMLIGRVMPSDRVQALEAKYASIQLKDDGAFGMEIDGDPWTFIAWRICGREYSLLERHERVMDVVAAPESSGGQRSRLASCAVDGSALDDATCLFFASDAGTQPRPVTEAWRIDGEKLRFERLVGREIVCTPYP